MNNELYLGSSIRYGFEREFREFLNKELIVKAVYIIKNLVQMTSQPTEFK